MSDAITPAPARARPTSVTVSSWLLFLVAALQLINTVVALSTMGTIADVYQRAYEGTAAAGAGKTIATVTIVVTVVFGLLITIGLVVLAIFNNRGKNASRIVTWVIGGIWLCCSGVGLVSQLAGNVMNFGARRDDMPDPAEVQRMLNDALPSWYRPVTVTTSVLTLVALLAALILLALPASNQFFRRPQPGLEPPVPGYPSVPGYPGSQGQPSGPETPPGPPTS